MLALAPPIIDPVPSDREPSLGEVADDIREVRDLVKDVQRATIPRDVYQAQQESLRAEMKLEFNNVRTEMKMIDGKAGTAQRIALWVLGMFAVAVLGVVTGIIARLI